MARRKIGTLYYDTNLEEGVIKITGGDLFYGVVALDTISDWITQLEELHDKKLQHLLLAHDKELQSSSEVYASIITELKKKESVRGKSN